MQRSDVIALLGTQQRDKVTGFTGMVSSVSFDAYGCVQCILTPPTGKDGKYPDVFWFDVNRLEAVKGKRTLPVPDFSAYGIDKGPAEKPIPR